MKKLIFLFPFCLLLIITSCKDDVEIPSSTLLPTIKLQADAIAVAEGTYILNAEGRSAYGGAKLRKVEFYKGAEKIGEKDIAPYTWAYPVVENIPDQELSFHAVLSDVVGNNVKSDVVTATVKVLPIRIEAEHAVLRGLARVATDRETRETSSNQAKVGAIDNAESGIDVTIDVRAAGEYLIRVAAGTGFNGTAHKIYVDGKEAEAQIYDIPNLGWNVWQTFDMLFDLEVGSHKISIRRQNGYGELDYVEYSKR
ncbi:CBM35 domain-containing protein [Sphingobacterium sp. SGR-19]|uniref:CBM35 domain-containing protein n=1 Tax=Sphingobacterium sp. SGR-19 TaxID=2710886 RepID=UPI0013EC65F8|nr:CBM35 domain-containing protein [Sphingobacterium sp. SGR-19]NGM66598.1 hypothetical protein [Sphingobacterium sp. SGR-19]